MGEAPSSCQSPLSSKSQSGYDSEMSSVKPWGFFLNRLRGMKMGKKKKVQRRNPWFWHAELVLILSNPRICGATSLLGCLIFLRARCAFTCPLRKSSSLFPPTAPDSPLSLPPSLPPHAYPFLVSVSPLPWHDNKSQGLRGSCLRWGGNYMYRM